MERMTIANPNGNTYRVSAERAGLFRIEAIGMNIAYMGDLIDKLGKYEDTGLTPEEVRLRLNLDGRGIKNGGNSRENR